ncbi:MAG TPA: hypothetical protein VGD15_08275, partial [Kribbella sp.]
RAVGNGELGHLVSREIGAAWMSSSEEPPDCRTIASGTNSRFRIGLLRFAWVTTFGDWWDPCALK